MVEIKPLHGLTYNKEKIGNFSKVITPPNDVFSKEMEKSYKAKSPFNFAYLIIPDGNGDKYQNAAMLLDKWEKEKVFLKDEKTIYIYSESFSLNGKNVERLGFISLIKLEELGKGVLPHEKTLDKDLKNRVSLISATRADFGVPFLLYDDKEKTTDLLIEKEIKDAEPYIDFVDDSGVNHKLWKVSNSEFIEKIKNEMLKYQCIIADGHHRYKSALKVRDMLADVGGAKYALICFVNAFNKGMIILPTNRVVFDIGQFDMDSFLDKLKKYFEIEEISSTSELTKRIETTDKIDSIVFGVYSNINKKSYLLKLKNKNVLDDILPDNTEVYRKLDVNILHKIIIEDILGISEEKQINRENIDFVKGTEETIKKMEDERMQLAFFVNPPLIEEVFLTARAGETMPQKSTYFYPKVFSGLVVYKM